MGTALTIGVVFTAGMATGAGIAWRRHEALRMTVRTLERERDTFRRDDIQTWLDDIGPVTPPGGLDPSQVTGLPLFDPAPRDP